jgi:3-deoxy-manno-octulosonate cytidylyltransferase (CMP-KDO synthetase)
MSTLNIVAIIPARMSSSRFPDKPLAPILGLPMIEHCRRRIEKVDILSGVYVATCDQAIREVVERHGGKVLMTADTHERAAERVEEAARSLEADIVVMLQGDEPMVLGECVEEVVQPFFEQPEVQVTNLVCPITEPQVLDDVNVVKTVLSRSHRLLYLSRLGIPGGAPIAGFQYYKQTGIIAFRKDFLHQYQGMEPTPLEIKESVDVNRILENDYWIQGVISAHDMRGVDLPEHIGLIEKLMLEDPLQKSLFEEITKDA